MPASSSTVSLTRRGVRHGCFRASSPVDIPGELRDLWAAAEPLHFAGALREGLRDHRADVGRTGALFARLRQDRDLFRHDVARRLDRAGGFAAGPASRDLSDPREIEKVHAERSRARGAGLDVWAKLSWISRDARDASLRIRFSFGSEVHDDWRTDVRRAKAADAFGEAAFPECQVLARDRAALRLLRRATGGPVRLSERILFANAPGGGAVFHHDAETDQLGVAYAQLAGQTAWLALPKRELAALVAEGASGRVASLVRTPARALRALALDSAPLDRLLNSTPRFTRALAERGRLYVLAAGDLLLLPSPGKGDAAWHSVFALGRRPSLALSCGIFRDTSRGLTPPAPARTIPSADFRRSVWTGTS